MIVRGVMFIFIIYIGDEYDFLDSYGIMFFMIGFFFGNIDEKGDLTEDFLDEVGNVYRVG